MGTYPISERVEGQVRGWQQRRGGACQNALGHIKGGHGACMRSWLGLGHVKGVWDVSRMVVACQEGVRHIETHWDTSKGAVACV